MPVPDRSVLPAALLIALTALAACSPGQPQTEAVPPRPIVVTDAAPSATVDTTRTIRQVDGTTDHEFQAAELRTIDDVLARAARVASRARAAEENRARRQASKSAQDQRARDAAEALQRAQDEAAAERRAEPLAFDHRNLTVGSKGLRQRRHTPWRTQ